MEEYDLAELLKALRAAGVQPDPSRLGGYLQALGIDGRDPEAAAELLGRMGLDCRGPKQKEELVSQINRITAGFGHEQRREIGGLFEEMMRRMGYEKLPQDFSDFLERWKKGE